MPTWIWFNPLEPCVSLGTTPVDVPGFDRPKIVWSQNRVSLEARRGAREEGAEARSSVFQRTFQYFSGCAARDAIKPSDRVDSLTQDICRGARTRARGV